MKFSKSAYSPPYDSPLEDDFAYNIFKLFDIDVRIIPQFEVKTICGTFRIDFVAETSSGLIGFECDGKEFHDQSRDEWRDAMILGSKSVNSIYRLRGVDIYYRIEDILYIVSRWNPELFNNRNILNLETLASDEARKARIEIPKSIVMITYEAEEESPYYLPKPPVYLCMERRHAESPTNRRQFWESAYDFALKEGGGKLDDIINLYRTKKNIEIPEWRFSAYENAMYFEAVGKTIEEDGEFI